MTPMNWRKRATQYGLFVSLLIAGYACGGDADKTAPKLGKAGDECTKGSECESGMCKGSECTASGGRSAASGGGSNSSSSNNSSSSGGSSNASGSSNSSNGTVDANSPASIPMKDPPFKGLGTSWKPLSTGCAPGTASQCAGACEAAPDANAKVIRAPALLCFGADSTQGVADPTPETPAAIIEQVIETLDGKSYVHIRATLDPAFVDNTYGDNSSAGWNKPHTFEDQLTKSDHIDLLFTNGKGETVLTLGEDYISSLSETAGPAPKPAKDKPGAPGGPGAPGAGGATSTSTQVATAGAPSTSSSKPLSGCGFDTLGVSGGDGEMTLGNASSVLAAATSISRNLGGCGYCSSEACSASKTGIGAGDCTVNSPATDENYTPNKLTPNWNYNVVYEVWLDLAAFGDSGFGQAYINYVHASPSKISTNTLNVVPAPCPGGWGVCSPGQNCSYGPPSSGTGGASSTGVGGESSKSPPGGNAGTGGPGACAPNYQLYITEENVGTCTPIPFAGYPNMAPCPEGFVLDTASEGQFCIPTK